MDKIQEMLKLKHEVEVLTVKYDAIRKEIETGMGDESIKAEYNGNKFNIIKIRKLSFSLKPGLKQEDILDRFPLASKTSVDLEVLKSDPTAHELFEPKEIIYLAIKSVKESNQEEDGMY